MLLISVEMVANLTPLLALETVDGPSWGTKYKAELTVVPRVSMSLWDARSPPTPSGDLEVR